MLKYICCLFAVLATMFGGENIGFAIESVHPRGTEAEQNRIWTSGARAFSRCMHCHSLNNDDNKQKFGPNLVGIVGRPIASQDWYDYSPALKAQDGIWTKDKLNRFIARPNHAVNNTKMPYSGMLSPHARADLIEYLEAVGKLLIQVTPNTGSLENGNPERGSVLSRSCYACHNTNPDDGHKIGPNLYGVVGRDMASASGFSYSERLLKREGIWTPESLNAFFYETKQFEQGTHIAFLQLQSLQDRAGIIAWLSSLTETP